MFARAIQVFANGSAVKRKHRPMCITMVETRQSPERERAVR